MGCDGQERGCREGADRPENDDRQGRLAEAAGPDLGATFEEDDEEGDRRDALHVLKRQGGGEPPDEVGGGGCDDEEKSRARNAEPPGDHPDHDREQQSAGAEEDQTPEVENVIHQ